MTTRNTDPVGCGFVCSRSRLNRWWSTRDTTRHSIHNTVLKIRTVERHKKVQSNWSKPTIFFFVPSFSSVLTELKCSNRNRPMINIKCFYNPESGGQPWMKVPGIPYGTARVLHVQHGIPAWKYALSPLSVLTFNFLCAFFCGRRKKAVSMTL